jgi:predicted DNA-binding transcriptional regulator AlpA
MIDIRGKAAQENHEPSGYKRIKSVIPIYGMSAATIWRKVKDGTFPKPVKLSAGVTAWKIEDLLAWESDPLNYRAEV